MEALMDRVEKLLRLDVAEAAGKTADPSRALDSIERDIDNQLVQVKTEMAVAVATRHKLDREAARLDEQAAMSLKQADLALAGGRDAEARAAAAQVIAIRRQAAELRERAEARARLAEQLRSLWTGLRTQLESVKAAREARAAESGNEAAASEVDILLGGLRRT